MRTLKFQPIHQKRQESFHIADYHLNDFSFDGKNRKVNSNVNLSIYIDDYCNAACKFCLSQMTLNKRENKKQRIPSDEVYLKRLDYVLDYLKPLNPTISITGGEPTKSPRLIPVLQKINEYNYRKRTLSTNGTGLLEVMEGKKVIEYIIENRFQNMTVSIAHHNPDLNQKMMQYKEKPFSEEDLKKVIAFSKVGNLHTRLSCVLLKEGINDLPSMFEYQKHYETLGLDNILFRELSYADISQYCHANKVDIDDIIKEVKQDKAFSYIKSIDGYEYLIDVYKHSSPEKENLVKIYTEKPVAEDIIYEMVFYPNGDLDASWAGDLLL